MDKNILDYLRDIPARGIRKALKELFTVLNQGLEKREPYLAETIQF